MIMWADDSSFKTDIVRKQTAINEEFNDSTTMVVLLIALGVETNR